MDKQVKVTRALTKRIEELSVSYSPNNGVERCPYSAAFKQSCSSFNKPKEI